ncbi:potassium/proton antiporter [Actinoallomurus rhizosphaericola]|uniref:potassium/proton antiporter n=1 Tax=Actinoallomurus rhizosphaericola TaxID=2952536 RepID=UPI00209107F2|nr:potassium/proton antiporter [Actinoallomurus rhizosphaericola]MCO5992876.1 potassium/proton antiporter [Actinoallomurus rhizosphaericola]
MTDCEKVLFKGVWVKLDLWLLLGSIVIITAIVAVRLAHRSGLPSLLLYLALGLILGESGIGIRFNNMLVAETLGLAALVLILAEGGLTTRWASVRDAIPAALSLSIAGTAVSIAVVAAAAHWLVGIEWRPALLLGAVLAPTDAAAVFSVLRRLPLPARLTGILEAESGFNDAPVVILVVALSAKHVESPVIMAVELVYELVAGAAIGLLVGWLGAHGLRRAALPASGLYPIAVLALAVGAYGAASMAHASGFLATYLAALVLGNSRLPHRPATRGFAEGLATLAQIGLFITLGLLASPHELPAQLGPALICGFALVLVARPLSVLASTPFFGLDLREKAFLSWAGLRGAVPIVLATIPVTAGLPGARELFAQVFIIVVVFTLLQGPTLSFLARLLRVAVADRAREIDVEAAPLEELHADLLDIRIPPDSRLDNVEIFELRLPEGAVITLIVREGRSFVPGPDTALLAGDELLVVATSAARPAAERRLRAVSRRGKLAGWYGEHGYQ